jgi:cytochrome c oxidase cbb3-type subunit 3
MKFINYLESLSGVSIYGLASLLIFSLFFLLMLIWTMRAEKSLINEIRNIPLDEEPPTSSAAEPAEPTVKPAAISNGGKAILQKSFFFFLILFWSFPSFAAGPKPTDQIYSPLAIVLLIVIAALLLAIGILAYTVLGAADVYEKKWLNPSDKKNSQSGISQQGMIVLLIVGAAFFMSSPVYAADGGSTVQQASTGSMGNNLGGLSPLTFYTLLGVIALELIVLIALLMNLRYLMGIGKVVTAWSAEPAGEATKVGEWETVSKQKQQRWFERWNKFIDRDQEHTIDMGHEYDGIRELDNRLPPWWLYGFYLTIIFSVIYIWRFHVSGSGPSSAEEFRREMVIAEREKEAYLKKAANNIDEKTVTLLTDPNSLAAGKNLYSSMCAACHGVNGEGGVGPNFTDGYWLHGNSVNEIFKTIKYGVTEKGMKAWKDDFSPAQIAQLSSFIKSLENTNFPGGKEAQGVLAASVSADSVSAASASVDSTMVP